MGLVEPHPHDEGKFQATFNDYGHGVGNGKSRSAVFKHHKKWQAEGVAPAPARETHVHEEVENVQIEPTAEEESEESGDFVQTEYGRIEWAEDDEKEPKPHTIPKPLTRMARGEQTRVTREATKSAIRYGYVALDRLITHWGRGVMNEPTYEIIRSSHDYDALQDSTQAVLDHYGIQVPMSPMMVWGATVGAAYGPPLHHIRKNAGPNRKRGGIKNFFARFTRAFKRGKHRKTSQNREVRNVDENPEP